MVFNGYINIQIALFAAAFSGFTGAVNAHTHVIFHSGRNFNFKRFFNPCCAFTIAIFTFIFNNASFAMTFRTFCLCLHNAQHGAYGFHYYAATVTVGTSGGLTTSLGTRTMASITANIFFNLKFLSNACSNFL